MPATSRRVPPESELALMRRIDELHLEPPFAGNRMLRDNAPMLRMQGIERSGGATCARQRLLFGTGKRRAC